MCVRAGRKNKKFKYAPAALQITVLPPLIHKRMAADQPTYVVLETSMGAITCELYNRHAPKYVGAVDVGDRESILTYGRATGRAKTLQNLYASEYMQCYNNVN